MRFVNFRAEGCFLLEPLQEVLEEVGFVNVRVEDRTRDLEEYAAEQIMAGFGDERKGEGKEETGGALCPGNTGYPKGTGYFLLVAEKPL